MAVVVLPSASEAAGEAAGGGAGASGAAAEVLSSELCDISFINKIFTLRYHLFVKLLNN